MPRPAPARPPRETLAAMRDKKMSVTAIARVFDVRVETARQWLNDYDFPSFLKRPPTPARDELESLRAQGLGLDPIAQRYGVHHSTVANWLKRYGLPPAVERHAPPVSPPPKPDVAAKPKRESQPPPRDDLAALRAQGWSMTRIARHYHVADGRVGKWLDAHGLPRHSPRAIHGPDRETLLRLRAEGKTRQEIADLCGISLASLTVRIHDYKLPHVAGGFSSRSPGRDVLITLVAQGKTQAEIAAQYGVSPTAARKWLRNAGLRASRGAPRKEARPCETKTTSSPPKTALRSPKTTFRSPKPKNRPVPPAAARSTGKSATRSTAKSATSSTSTTSRRARRVTAMAASTPAVNATSPSTPTLSEFRDGVQRARERRDEEMRRLQAAYKPLAFRPPTRPVCTTPPDLRAELNALAELMHAETSPSPYAVERTPEQRRAISGASRNW